MYIVTTEIQYILPEGHNGDRDLIRNPSEVNCWILRSSINESEFKEWVGTFSVNPLGVYQKSRFINPP